MHSRTLLLGLLATTLLSRFCLGCGPGNGAAKAAGPIPDPTLALAVANVAKVSPAALTPVELQRIVTLDVRPSDAPKVKSLSGIQKCDHLRSLVLIDQEVHDLAPLGSMTSLIGLNVEGNGLTSITPLAPLVQLEWLHVGHNELDGLEALTGMTRLTLLNAQDNHLASVIPLAGCTALSDLNLRNNQLTSLEGLGQLKSLQQVFVGGNPLTTLKPLIDNPGFTLNDRLVLDATQSATLEKDINELKSKGVQIVVIEKPAEAPGTE